MVGSPPANAGDTGLIPGRELRSHMPRSMAKQTNKQKTMSQASSVKSEFLGMGYRYREFFKKVYQVSLVCR